MTKHMITNSQQPQHGTFSQDSGRQIKNVNPMIALYVFVTLPNKRQLMFTPNEINGLVTQELVVQRLKREGLPTTPRWIHNVFTQLKSQQRQHIQLFYSL